VGGSNSRINFSSAISSPDIAAATAGRAAAAHGKICFADFASFNQVLPQRNRR
jgi:hypothetical protein